MFMDSWCYMYSNREKLGVCVSVLAGAGVGKSTSFLKKGALE